MHQDLYDLYDFGLIFPVKYTFPENILYELYDFALTTRHILRTGSLDVTREALQHRSRK